MLERALRHYWNWQALYLSEGLEEIDLGDGVTLNIHDVRAWIDRLPYRMRVAVVLTCLYNHREKDAARIMGKMRRHSTVGQYKRRGLERIAEWYAAENER